MTGPTLTIEPQGEGSTGDLALKGVLTMATAGRLLEVALPLIDTRGAETLRLDMAGVTEIDSAGAGVLLALWRRAEAQSRALKLVGASETLRSRLALFVVETHDVKVPPTVGTLERLGMWGVEMSRAGLDLLIMASETSAEALLGIAHPKNVRWRELFLQMARIGSNALGTVGLITFLVGLTLAFQSAHQLRQYGAAMWVADLTAVAMFREMGPLMTAILVAGRSGSAIAAEIATMKVSEELDALEVMGIPFTRFLGLPRVLAMLVVMPMLVVMADLIGILGGLFVGILYLDLSITPYLNATLNALGPKDLTMTLVKAVTFGWGIAVIALNRGVSVTGGAQEVGTATTASVVQSLFFIILMDAAFSILFYVVL